MANKFLDESSESESEEDIDIHEIVRTGTLQEVKDAIARDRPRLIALKDKYGRVAIHYAAALDKTDVVMHLIVKKTDLNPKDNNEQTPLHLAAARGLTDMCRTLLEFQANIKLRDKGCWTALHHSVNGRFLETSTLLVKRGVDLSAEDHKHGRTALHIAAEKGYQEIAEMLIIRGADMYAKGDAFYSQTPLHLACAAGHTETVRVLVKRWADKCALSGFLDKNPLHLACEKGHYDSARLLVEDKMDLDLMGNHINGCTALHLAVIHGFEDIVKLLVQHGAAIDLWGRFTTEGAALHVACEHGRMNMVRLLLELGADRNNKDNNGFTPLHAACKHGHYDIALWLIDHEADFRLEAANKKVPLDYVAVSTAKELLVIACGKADMVRARQEAALAEARRIEEARLRAIEMERLRLERLAEEERQYKARRQREFTELMTKVVDASGELSALLPVIEEYPEQDVNVALLADTERQSTALVLAASHGFHSIVHALLYWPGVDVNAQDYLGNTALHYAAFIGHREMVEELILAPGVRAGVMNKEGKVAANYAKTNFLREVVRNPALVGDRVKYQDDVMARIFSSKKFLQEQAMTVQDTHSPTRCGGAATSPAQLSPSRGAYFPGSPSKMSSDTLEFAQGKFGYVPPEFGGSYADFFFRDAAAVELENELAATPVVELLQMQKHYVPTVFDRTEEWCEVKDFLWLLGYCYRPPGGNQENDSGLPPAAVDKRAHLFRVACVMNELQQLFTDTAPMHGIVGASTALPDSSEKLPTIPDALKRQQEPLRPQKSNPVLKQIQSSLYKLDETLQHGLALHRQPSAAALGKEVVCPEWAEYLATVEMPVNLSAVDFIRLVLFAQQCDEFVECLLRLFEPESGGWMYVQYDDPSVDVIEKLECVVQSSVISEEVAEQVRKLVQLGYNRSIRYRGDEAERAAGERQADMYANPPRYMRKVVDTVFEVAHYVKLKAEAAYAVDAIRAHFWAMNGRAIIRKKLQQISQHASELVNSAAASQHAAASVQPEEKTPLQRWLAELRLLEYEDYFEQEGFRMLSDFEGLSEEDCRDFFPFLKIGDLRRLSKHICLMQFSAVPEK